MSALTNAEQEALMWSCDNDTWGDHLAHVSTIVATARADERERVAAAVLSLDWLVIAENVWEDVPSQAEQDLARRFAEAFAESLHGALAQPADTEGA
jgi:hypothetical protein